jgi:hypothetical protein
MVRGSKDVAPFGTLAVAVLERLRDLLHAFWSTVSSCNDRILKEIEHQLQTYLLYASLTYM